MHIGDSLPARTDKLAMPDHPRSIAVCSLARKGRSEPGLGAYGYSYEFVLRAFRPLLERWGEVVELERPESQLDFALRRARKRGRQPLSLSFRPFSDAYLSATAPNVVFPFWEFPDVPATDYKDNPRYHWVRIANRASLVLTASEFTATVLARAGVQAPIRVVPVPVRNEYFEMPAWNPKHKTTLECTAYVFSCPEVAPLRPADPESRPGADSLVFRAKTKLRAWARRAWIAVVKPCLPLRLSKAVVAAKNAFRRAWREGETELPPPETKVELSGVVYTTFLNPDDKRKNWEDLLSAFLLATRDRDEATLVVKLVTSHAPPVREILGWYYKLGISHRSKLVFITSYLSDEQLQKLTQASAFYITATRAEGACLPLQDFLAAARPAISPRHTAIADYFDDRMGFVVASHPEPCPWPHDDSGRLNTTWQRIVWSSLADKIARSCDTAMEQSELYRQMGREGRRKMQSWASTAMVWPRLAEALALALEQGSTSSQSGKPPHYSISRDSVANPSHMQVPS
jgi:glycosyltransferase involved in cell wall biosynthesis